jgi:hypothetical protein
MKSYFLAFNFLRLACYPLSFLESWLISSIPKKYSSISPALIALLFCFIKISQPSFRGRKTYIIMPLFLCQALLTAFLGHKISTSH